jgi:Tol biopolymer transport system component
MGVDANAALYSPVFQPDGLKVVYLSEFTDNVTEELFIAAAGIANSATRLSEDPIPFGLNKGVSSGYKFSPDGKKVSYIAQQDTAGVRDLYLAAVNGGGSTKLDAQLEGGGRVFPNVVFSPDSRMAAYVAREAQSGNQAAYVATSDGNEVVNLNEALLFDTTNDEGYIIRFSPNQDYLIYEVYIDSLSRYTYQMIEITPEEDTTCFPIKLPNDKVVVPCL